MALGIIGAIGAGIGAIAGSQGKKQSSTSSVSVGRESEQEKEARQLNQQTLGEFGDIVGQGAGATQAAEGLRASEQFASDLEQARSQGLRPSDVDREVAQAQLAPQRVAADQAFEDANVQAQRLAAQLNRPINDPILQAKLQQERVRSQERLGAQESALAVGSAQQRLGFSEALAGVRQGLASQALQNRQTLLGLGQGIQQMGQNFRLGTGSTTTKGRSGGGLQGAITGAIGGVGAATSLFRQFGGGSSDETV